MSFKTNVIGLLAAAGLALSLAGTATAEEATGSASVTLGENQSAVGCTATLTGGDFGSATWNPATNQYEFDDGGAASFPFIGAATLSVELTYDGSFPNDTSTCDAQIKGTSFKTNPVGVNEIPVGQMSYVYSGTTYVMNTFDTTLFTDVDPAGADPQVGLTLNLAGITSPPDAYTSTLTVTITDHEE